MSGSNAQLRQNDPSAKRLSALTIWLRRALRGLSMLVGLLTVVFLAVRLAPGDPIDHLLGEQASVQEREALRTRMHLDGPLGAQYLDMLGDVADGTLGTSWTVAGRPTPVRDLILDRAPSTIALALASIVMAVLFAVPLGVMAARKPEGPADQVARLWSLLAVSTPAFVSGPLALFVLAVVLAWAPTPAHDVSPWAALVLPSAIIGFALSGRLARLLRASLVESLSADLTVAWRARGASEARILWRHALPNAALPVLTVLGLQLAALLGGALVTEKVFGRPGLGSLLLQGVAMRDYAVVQGGVVVIGLTYLLATGAVEALTRWLDPRLRS